MKRIFILSAAAALLISACEVIPEARFYTDTVEPEVGMEVFFTNDSYNAERFEWDFGDGTFSSAENPVHSYTGTGTFQVELKAYSRTGLVDKSYLTIKVFIPTLLEIEVLEYYDKYPVSGASVILYPSLSDWDAERNEVAEGYTDTNGKVVYYNPGNFVYYVDIWESNHDNYALRDEDVNFIRTDQVKPHQINRFVAYVDYVQHTKGESRRNGAVIVKKIERKAIPAESVNGTEGWQELMANAVKIKR